MSQLAIKGHPTRGKEVIEILEMLGGKNTTNLHGECDNMIYIINSSYYGEIIYMLYRTDGYVVFTLEEFLKKFPHKVGDKVCFPDDLSTPFTINKMWWDENANELLCSFIEDDIEVPVVGIRTYKEKTTDKANKPVFDANAQCCDIMNHLIKEETMNRKYNVEEYLKVWEETENGLEVVVNDNFELKEDNGKFYIIKKQPQYPKTYEECCEITNSKLDIHYFYTRKDKEDYPEDVKIMNIVDDLRRLLICRNAYWKIAGEQMGLGKPWEPDTCQVVYAIGRYSNEIVYHNDTYGGFFILEFPTKEMRDAFYENFKELVESCKELL